MMRLPELTPAERAFFEARDPDAGGFQARLGRRLAAALTARLRMPVAVCTDEPAARGEPRRTPAWRPDRHLAGLWLTRRLGGARVQGPSAFVPHTLIAMLDQQLAECWIEAGRPQTGTGPVWAWKLTAEAFEARLELHGPDQLSDMARWAQGVMQRG